VDFLDSFIWVDNLVKQTKFIVNSAIGLNLLLVYDGGIKRLELDLFHYLVAYWTLNLLWL